MDTNFRRKVRANKAENRIVPQNSTYMTIGTWLLLIFSPFPLSLPHPVINDRRSPRCYLFTTQYLTEVQKVCISPPVRERASVCEKRKFPSWHVWDGWIVYRLRRLAPSVVSVRRGGRRFTLLEYELWFLCPAIMHARGEGCQSVC